MSASVANEPTESPDPSFPVRDTESDSRWGWLGLACETRVGITMYIVRELKKLFAGDTLHKLSYFNHGWYSTHAARYFNVVNLAHI